MNLSETERIFRMYACCKIRVTAIVTDRGAVRERVENVNSRKTSLSLGGSGWGGPSRIASGLKISKDAHDA